MAKAFRSCQGGDNSRRKLQNVLRDCSANYLRHYIPGYAAFNLAFDILEYLQEDEPDIDDLLIKPEDVR